MTDMLVIKKHVGDDGTIVLHLTPGSEVEITVKEFIPAVQPDLTAEEEAALDARLSELLNDPTTFSGLGLTAAEIANSPEFGAWANRTDIEDGAAYVEKLRSKKRYTW